MEEWVLNKFSKKNKNKQKITLKSGNNKNYTLHSSISQLLNDHILAIKTYLNVNKGKVNIYPSVFLEKLGISDFSKPSNPHGSDTHIHAVSGISRFLIFILSDSKIYEHHENNKYGNKYIYKINISNIKNQELLEDLLTETSTDRLSIEINHLNKKSQDFLLRRFNDDKTQYRHYSFKSNIEPFEVESSGMYKTSDNKPIMDEDQFIIHPKSFYENYVNLKVSKTGTEIVSTQVSEHVIESLRQICREIYKK